MTLTYFTLRPILVAYAFNEEEYVTDAFNWEHLAVLCIAENGQINVSKKKS